MQLTKDDVKDYGTFKYPEPKLDFSKFQQVVEFYEKYKDKDVDFFWKEQKEIFKNVYLKYLEERYKKVFPELVINCFHDWLFNYCFVEGLK